MPTPAFHDLTRRRVPNFFPLSLGETPPSPGLFSFFSAGLFALLQFHPNRKPINWLATGHVGDRA